VILAFSDAETIVAIVAVFFIVLALIVLARLTMRALPPSYSHWRFGVFVEREGNAPDDDDPSEQITQTWPKSD
jgi:hypothetical protein